MHMIMIMINTRVRVRLRLAYFRDLCDDIWILRVHSPNIGDEFECRPTEGKHSTCRLALPVTS